MAEEMALRDACARQRRTARRKAILRTDMVGFSPMAAVDESPADISSSEFRRAMGHFATGVTVVTSIDEAGEPVGTTASAVSSLSLNPPLVLVCFDLGSLTLRAIRGHGAFVVN